MQEQETNETIKSLFQMYVNLVFFPLSTFKEITEYNPRNTQQQFLYNSPTPPIQPGHGFVLLQFPPKRLSNIDQSIHKKKKKSVQSIFSCSCVFEGIEQSCVTLQ